MTIRDQLRAIRKFIFFTGYVLSYLIESSLGRIVVRDQVGRRRFHSWVVSRYCRGGCALLHTKINVIDPPPPERNFLLVGNHLGFLDILVLASIKPSLFVTSVEMKETPFLGTLCEMGGCLFVERRSRSNILNEMGEMREALQQGFSVVLYPEGTSGNGLQVLPFKKTLLTSAARTEVPIKVMVLNYRRINGEKISNKWRDYVCWYGDMTFVSAIWRLFCLRSIEVDLSFHDEIPVATEDDRHHVAARAQAIVEKHFDPIPFE